MLKIIECPRDAMQGLKEFVPTELKIEYINALLRAGFDTLDFGSFVSPKAIPQMQDTKEVLAGLNLSNTKTKLLAIVANVRGAEEASKYSSIKYLGFPFSISETFQQRNTNSSIIESLATVKEMQGLAEANKKELVVYISMGFGNPYNDEWSSDIVLNYVDKIQNLGVKIVSIADTVGVSTPEKIHDVFSMLAPRFPQLEIGSHLHSNPSQWKEKIQSAYDAGCRRIDSALKGFGGCPMADDDLVGNIATENLLSFFDEKKIQHGIDMNVLKEAMLISTRIFPI